MVLIQSIGISRDSFVKNEIKDKLELIEQTKIRIRCGLLEADHITIPRAITR